MDLGLFTYRTQMTLIAVPEPSAYAAILGALALAGVVIRRRRQSRKMRLCFFRARSWLRFW